MVDRYRQWVKDKNRFLTYPWVSSIDEPTILAALYAGRAFVGELGTFSGALDLLVDGYVRMGEVSVRPDLTSRTVNVLAYNLPAGSSVRVVQGPIDNPGHSTPGPGSTAVAVIPATAFATGGVPVSVDTSTSTFVRCEVITSATRTVAFTNPVYLLTGPAARPIPPERQADP